MEASFSEELKKTWLTSLMGFLLLCAGTLLLTWNEVSQSSNFQCDYEIHKYLIYVG